MCHGAISHIASGEIAMRLRSYETIPLTAQIVLNILASKRQHLFDMRHEVQAVEWLIDREICRRSNKATPAQVRRLIAGQQVLYYFEMATPLIVKRKETTVGVLWTPIVP